MNISNKKYHLPVGYSLIQTLFKSNEFLNNPIEFISKSMEAYSGTYTARLGFNRKLILTQNHDFIEYILKENHKNYQKSELTTKRAVQFFGNGLLFSNGNYWLKQRRLIQPAFHREKLRGLYEIMIKSIEDFLIHFPSGKNIDVFPLVHQCSFNIILQSLFNIKIPSNVREELNEIFTSLQNFLIKDINQPLRKIFYPFTNVEEVQLKKAKRLREIFSAIIDQRNSSDSTYTDLLDMLLNSKYEDTGASMTKDQIIDELLIIIFAGHETTANTLSWMLYLFSTNQESTVKLTESFKGNDIDECLQNDYLKACINESMRLYPSAWMKERVALEDDTFGNFSYPKNTIIIPFFYGLHRNNELWKDPSLFNPERFIIDQKISKSKNYFPFGSGPRMCIGNNFAMAEMSFFIFLFFKKFKIQQTGQIPEMKALITLRPDKVLLDIQKMHD